MAKLKNPHPGDILKYEFLDELDMSQNALAKAIGVPANRIHAIVNGTRDITADTDLRLCKFFGMSEGFFQRLQILYDTREAKRKLKNKIEQIQPFKYDTNNNTHV
ncbi:MAG: HigA family addiction module antitoxin [Rickettsiales bacterium]|nr:HigA family addiction module antitoxin [Pseudomonadota bacterium]MDA0965425.1 HigA family addiction module antitoxin [Pseudomonadota bacterium]MDG4542750.1 HigA family addiction module antitoxin [Rickettsiales bacterium]MDG4544802.1 HigA family addiction module antitoxin [Rickettsiales bacterium]MDG4546924.1 HigA family addiction module antitoxin [Rickettsiales bacterium]